MDYTTIAKVVEAEGYITHSDLLAKLGSDNAEVIDTNLKFLTTKNRIRKIRIAKSGKCEDLYFIPG